MKLGILGASGRTRRLVVRKPLDTGHEVRALVRTPAKLGIADPRLEAPFGAGQERP